MVSFGVISRTSRARDLLTITAEQPSGVKRNFRARVGRQAGTLPSACGPCRTVSKHRVTGSSGVRSSPSLLHLGWRPQSSCKAGAELVHGSYRARTRLVQGSYRAPPKQERRICWEKPLCAYGITIQSELCLGALEG